MHFEVDWVETALRFFVGILSFFFGSRKMDQRFKFHAIIMLSKTVTTNHPGEISLNLGIFMLSLGTSSISLGVLAYYLGHESTGKVLMEVGAVSSVLSYGLFKEANEQILLDQSQVKPQPQTP